MENKINWNIVIEATHKLNRKFEIPLVRWWSEVGDKQKHIAYRNRGMNKGVSFRFHVSLQFCGKIPYDGDRQKKTFTQNVYAGDTSLTSSTWNKRSRTRYIVFPTTIGVLLLQLTHVRCLLAAHSILHSSTFDNIKYEKIVRAFIMGRLKVWWKYPIRWNCCFDLEWNAYFGK